MTVGCSIEWEKSKAKRSKYGSVKNGGRLFKRQAKSKMTSGYKIHAKHMTGGYKKSSIISFCVEPFFGALFELYLINGVSTT